MIKERQVWRTLSTQEKLCISYSQTESLCIQDLSYFIPSVGPCLPNVLMTLATVTTEETHLSLIPS